MALSEASAAVIGAGISAAASGTSAAVGSSGRRKSQRRAYQYQKSLMDYQNSIALQNWEKENDYNSPSAQMARYQDAGLNANLIYGQANTAGSIGEYQPTSVSPIESYGETIGQAIESSANSFLETYAKLTAIKGSQLDNTHKGYDNDLRSMDVQIATATFEDKLSDVVAELEDSMLSHFTNIKRNQGLSEDYIAKYEAQKQYGRGNLVKMYKDDIKSLATQYAISIMYDSDNARNSHDILDNNAKLSKFNTEFEEKMRNLDISKMKTGEIMKLVFRCLTHAIGVAGSIGSQYNAYQAGRRADSDLQRKWFESYKD